MRALFFFPCLLVACAASQATAADPAAANAADGRRNQQIERIRIEDAGSRVDELRVGGETRSIAVQPKNGLPAYEMQPTDGARARVFDRDGLSSTTAQRVWNVLKF